MDKEHTYVLEMLPYPSGELHMGHVKNYTLGDVLAHVRRRMGFHVLRPMGYDAFGLPAENAAIREGGHPRLVTERNIAAIRQQMRRMGWAIDWDREVSTADPSYYRWTQWLFLKFYEEGLAYRKEAPVNWCPNDQTVLANEQVIDGRCERCGAEVERRDLEQWFFRITDYADRLLDEMSLLESWPEHVLTMQRNWIGRSEGAEVVFRIDELEVDIPVFTTRPDTLFGATFFVLAPEHPLVADLVAGTPREEEALEYVRRAVARSSIERADPAKEKTGVDTGAFVTNPVNGERIPIWVADYVLMEYGTGAIMAVPAHDERDFEFAERHGLPVKVVVAPEGEDYEEGTYVPHSENERLVDSGQFSGRPAEEGKGAIVDWLESQGLGRPEVGYRLRDWLLSRQRYWGCPIPILYCEVVRDGCRARARICPCCCPRSRSTCQRGARPSPRQRAGCTRPVRAAAAWRTARRTPWTRSSIPRGTSSATPTHGTTTRHGIARSPTTGCRSTSTSAASSTPSSTCSTRASS